MLNNLIKIAVRNLLKSKTFSLINILGLAFGLCCAMLISLWVVDEYKFDNYHAKKDRIYSVISELKSSAGSQYWTNSPGPLAEVLKKDISGIEEAVRYSRNRLLLFKREEGNLEESGINADPGIFNVFDFPLIEGNPETALDDPYNLVISKALANKLFPNANALNKMVTIGDWGSEIQYKITGILEDLPLQSTMQFEYIRSFEAYLKKWPSNMEWDNYNDRTVILIENDAEIDQVTKRISKIIQQNDESSTAELHTYPYKNLYLRADLASGIDAEGRIVYVRVFIIIALIIVLIACINFTNLSTARAGKRAKEVGIRKANGAYRSSLIKQFLGESVLIALISGALAITMADLLMPFFNELTDKSIYIPYGNLAFVATIVIVCVLTGVLAGIYPAIYLSKFNPSEVLKNAINSGKSLSSFRQILVIIQFSLSIVFVVATIIVYNQLEFIMSKDIGLNKDNILHHDLNGITKNREAYRTELMKISGVKEVTSANFSPHSIYNSTGSVNWKGKQEEDDDIFFHVIQTDQYFLEGFGAKLLAGEGFSDRYDTAAIEVVVNEEALKTMWIEMEDAIGSQINVWGFANARIVGVVKDFNHQDLSQKIEPVVILFRPRGAWRSFIAIDGSTAQIIRDIESVYSRFEKNYPFDYGFVEQEYAEKYANISIIGKLTTVFAIAAIIVSCLGLFGLTSYMIEQRKKETGIRKVMGASISGLVIMFSKKFLKLIVIAAIISIPIVWYLAAEWLKDFAFKVEIGVGPFLVGGLSAVFVAIATVSYHTIKAALSNPIDSLNYE